MIDIQNKNTFPHSKLRVYVKYNEENEQQFDVCTYSLIKNCSLPIEVIKLSSKRLSELGLCQNPNDLISPFFIPFLENFRGYCLYLSDKIVVNCDIASIYENIARSNSISVSKNNDIILFNCNSETNKRLNPKRIQKEFSNIINLEYAKHSNIQNLDTKYSLNYETEYSDIPDIINFANDNNSQLQYIYDSYLNELSEFIEIGYEVVEITNTNKSSIFIRFLNYIANLLRFKTKTKASTQIIPIYGMKIKEITHLIKEIEIKQGPPCKHCERHD